MSDPIEEAVERIMEEVDASVKNFTEDQCRELLDDLVRDIEVMRRAL